MQIFKLVASLASLASVCAALSNPLLPRQSSSPVPPSKDPFYTPKGDWQSQKPGAILDSRDVPQPLSMVNYTSAKQILYRTTDSLGNASYAMTTVIIPQNANFSQLLSYQIYYDTPDADCSPSYTLQAGGLFSLDTLFQGLLDSGAVVNTPDYEGPYGQFVAGVQSGQATLDSIRAVLASKDITKVEPDAQVVMWGYSGGALASEWAAELKDVYAPELNISAAALGGLTPNVTNVALTVNAKSFAGLIPAGIIGLVKAYPNITNLLNTSFTSPENREKFWSITSGCIATNTVEFSDVDFLSYFNMGAELLFDPRTQSIVSAGGQMGLHGIPSIPLYVYKSTLDQVSPVMDTDELINKYCLNGTPIQYIRDDFGDHLGEGGSGVFGATNFITGIFNGTLQVPQGCTIETLDKDGKVKSSSSVMATATPTPVSPSGGSGDAEETGTPGSSGSGSSGSGSGGSASSGAPGAATTTGAAVRADVNVKLAGLGLVGGLLLL